MFSASWSAWKILATKRQNNMHKLGLILFFVLFFAGFSALHAQKMATRDLRSDLDFLQKAFYQGHPGAFLFNTRDSLQLFFQDLSAHLKGDSVPVAQAMVTVMLATARLRDGHTSVLTPFYTDKTVVIPFTVQIIHDQAFILGNYSGDTTLKRGTELLEINGISSASVIRLGYLLHSGDGYNNSFQHAIASIYFPRHYSLLFGARARNRIKVRYADGSTAFVDAPGLPRAELIKRMRSGAKPPPAERTILRYRDMILRQDTLFPRLAILQLGGFPSGKYKKFYRKAFHWIQKHQISDLAIDLRYNTGGNVHNMEYLCANILDTSFQYAYERQKHTHIAQFFDLRGKFVIGLIWMKYHLSPGLKRADKSDQLVRIWETKPRRKNNFNGRVWVFTNGYSFSSASMAASFLKNRGHAQVIGSETGGNEAGNCGGGYPKLILPKSRFKIRFPLMHLHYGIGKNDTGQGVKPDIAVTYTLKDVLDDEDLELKRLYAILQQQKKK